MELVQGRQYIYNMSDDNDRLMQNWDTLFCIMLVYIMDYKRLTNDLSSSKGKEIQYSNKFPSNYITCII